MGKKKSRQESSKTHKYIHEKKQQINNTSMIKIMRPKVFITHSSNFKSLVQKLTGNVNEISAYNSPASSPPPSGASPPSDGAAAPFIMNNDIIQDHGYDQDHHHLSVDYLSSSLDSSCFSTPLGGSPDLSVPDPNLNYHVMENEAAAGEKINEFSCSSQFYKDLETLLMEMDIPVNSYNYDACYGNMNIQQEVCIYDNYDLSSLM